MQELLHTPDIDAQNWKTKKFRYNQKTEACNGYKVLQLLLQMQKEKNDYCNFGLHKYKHKHTHKHKQKCKHKKC